MDSQQVADPRCDLQHRAVLLNNSVPCQDAASTNGVGSRQQYWPDPCGTEQSDHAPRGENNCPDSSFVALAAELARISESVSGLILFLSLSPPRVWRTQRITCQNSPRRSWRKLQTTGKKHSPGADHACQHKLRFCPLPQLLTLAPFFGQVRDRHRIHTQGV